MLFRGHAYWLTSMKHFCVCFIFSGVHTHAHICIYTYRVFQDLGSIFQDLIPELMLSQKRHVHMGPIGNGSGVRSFESIVNKIERKEQHCAFIGIYHTIVMDKPRFAGSAGNWEFKKKHLICHPLSEWRKILGWFGKL